LRSCCGVREDLAFIRSQLVRDDHPVVRGIGRASSEHALSEPFNQPESITNLTSTLKNLKKLNTFPVNPKHGSAHCRGAVGPVRAGLSSRHAHDYRIAGNLKKLMKKDVK